MRKAVTALVLVLALGCSTLAGEIPNPPVTPPPPGASAEQTLEGDIPSPPLVVFVLTLLSLF